ncbi:MAG: DEAD/DEAH box helicase, partial [Rhodanobacter sp.]
MHQPEEKQRGVSAPAVADEALSSVWRQWLASALPVRRNEPVVLGFFLEVIPEEGVAFARLDAAPVLLTVIEHGRYARPVPMDSRHLAQAPLPPHEQRLAATVLGLPQSPRKGRNYARLSGHLGDTLLADMLDTTPCFLGGLVGLRLSRGRSHPLNWHWGLEPDGSQPLLPLLPNNQRALRIDTLWYLDAEHAALGRLEAAAEETHWLDMPALTYENSQRLARQLPASRLATRVPLPRVFGELRRSQLAPKPVLTLHALTRHARLAAGTPPLAYACLAFDYAGERLPGRGGEPLVRRVRNGQLVEISRRRADELSAMEQLERAGLTPGVDTEGLPWDVAETLPDEAWLFPGTGNSGALEVNTPARWL